MDNTAPNLTTLPADLDAVATLNTRIDASLALAASAGYRRADFTRMGLTRTEIDALFKESTLADVVVMTAQHDHDIARPNDIVTIVPANQNGSTARDTIAAGWYARVLSKASGVPHAATMLAITDGGHVTEVSRILARFYVPGPGVASPHAGLANVIDSEFYAEHFDEPSDVILLAMPETLPSPVALGYRNVQGVRSFTYADLASGATLAELSTVR